MSGGATAAFVAIQAGQKQKELLTRFRERGAVSESTAKTLKELDLEKHPALRWKTMQKALCKVGEGRYYLNEAALAEQQSLSRVMIALVLAAVLAAALLANLLG
jgi:hypothetical protein